MAGMITLYEKRGWAYGVETYEMNTSFNFAVVGDRSVNALIKTVLKFTKHCVYYVSAFLQGLKIGVGGGGIRTLKD